MESHGAGIKLVTEPNIDIAHLSLAPTNSILDSSTHAFFVQLSLGPLLEPLKHLFGMNKQSCDMRIK